MLRKLDAGSNDMKINLEAVKALEGCPRVHGNGFIQMDIGAGRRLHVWGHRDLPRQKVDTGIHDHTFDFVSTCIVGRVVNVVYGVDYDPTERVYTHKIYRPEPRDGEDTALEPTLQQCRPYVHSVRLVNSIESYSHEALVFHETFTDRPSATVMQKGNKTPGVKARVLIPLGFEPDNEFNRNDFPAERLWEIIYEVLSY